jgi:predicted HicB family RNase H-like nuclease
MARIQADVDEQVKTDAKIAALKQGVTLSQLVEAAIREYLERHKL